MCFQQWRVDSQCHDHYVTILREIVLNGMKFSPDIIVWDQKPSRIDVTLQMFASYSFQWFRTFICFLQNLLNCKGLKPAFLNFRSFFAKAILSSNLCGTRDDGQPSLSPYCSFQTLRTIWCSSIFVNKQDKPVTWVQTLIKNCQLATGIRFGTAFSDSSKIITASTANSWPILDKET